MVIASPNWNDDERNVMAVRDEMSTATWAARYRMITQGPLIGIESDPIRWSNETFPLQRAIMAAADDPDVSSVVIMGPPQAGGKTDVLINVMLHALEHSRVDVLYVNANQRKAADQWMKKIKPAIRASDVSWIIPEDREKAGDKHRRDMTNGFSLFLAGAESVANISANTIPMVICDDVQAMPQNMIGAGHAVDVASSRSKALPETSRTLMAAGTALGHDDYLHRLLKRSSHCKPYVPCMGCGRYQLLSWDRMEFEDDDPVEARKDCRMRCDNEQCNHRLAFVELQDMLTRFVWCPRGQSVGDDGRLLGDAPKTTVVGFWWNALYWPFVNWTTHAVQHIEAVGTPERELDFEQHILTIPHKPSIEEGLITVSDVEERKQEDHLWGTVPAEADLITEYVDVHDRFLYYVVRAWRQRDGRSWLVDAGTEGVHSGKDDVDDPQERDARVNVGIRQSLQEMFKAEKRGWPTCGPGGRILRILNARAVAVDGGYRPNIVHQSCQRFNSALRFPKWFMTLGRRGQTIELWPAKPSRSKKSGVLYYPINVDELKHILRELLAIPPGEPGEWSVYSNRDLEAYFRHLVSERFGEVTGSGQTKKKWTRQKGAGPNHWLDCEVGNIALAIACGVKLIGHGYARKKREQKQTPTREPFMTPRGQPFMLTDR